MYIFVRTEIKQILPAPESMGISSKYNSHTRSIFYEQNMCIFYKLRFVKNWTYNNIIIISELRTFKIK